MKKRWIAIVLGPTILLSSFIAAGNRVGRAEDWRERLGSWQYPRSEIRHGGDSGAGGPPSHSVASMTTPDRWQDIIKFYEEKTKRSLTPGKNSVSGKAGQGAATIFQVGPMNRPIQLLIFGEHTKDHSITLVISRGEKENLTHIYWSYVKH